MFAPLLPALTLVALGLLVPAGVVAMMRARGRHASAGSDAERWGRVGVAVAVAGSAGSATAWVLGSGAASSALTALLLAVPVLVWAYLAPWWPVRAVVAWAMLVTGAVGSVGLATARALESSEPWSALPVAGAGAGVVVHLLERLNGPFRRLLGIRAGIRRAVRTPALLRPALLRPALAVTVFFAALAAGGLTGVAPRPGDGRSPAAGSGPDPGSGPSGGQAGLEATDVRTVSAVVATPSETAGDAEGELPAGEPHGTRTGSTGSGSEPGGALAAAPARSSDGAAGTGSTAGRSTSSESTSPSGGTEKPVTESEPVRQVADTVSTTTETVQQTTEALTDGGNVVTEPVRSVVEQIVEPVVPGVEQTVEQVTDPLASTLP